MKYKLLSGGLGLDLKKGVRVKTRNKHCANFVPHQLSFTSIYWHFETGQTPQVTDLITFKK
jgi:hypothetical protein